LVPHLAKTRTGRVKQHKISDKHEEGHMKNKGRGKVHSYTRNTAGKRPKA